MATTTSIKTVGTTATTSLKGLQWLPSSQAPGATAGLQWTADLQTMMAYVTGEANIAQGNSHKFFAIPRVSNGVLYFEGRGQTKLFPKTPIRPADWLIADPISGYMFVLPDYVFTIASNVFTHS